MASRRHVSALVSFHGVIVRDFAPKRSICPASRLSASAARSREDMAIAFAAGALKFFRIAKRTGYR